MFRRNPQHKAGPPQVSKIMGIQFSILSPEEIERGSVVEVTSKEMYTNNRPCHGGLFDPRMGVLEPGLICPTDGMDYMTTPGYFGHIRLARPVFYIQYLSTVLKLLRCVCMKCSKLLIDKNLHRELMSLRPDERWTRVYQLASKVKGTRCGKETEDGCGCLQPDKIKKDGLANIFAEWSKISNNGGGGADSGSGTTPNGNGRLNLNVTPEMVIKIFKRISNEDIEFMGFSAQFSRPEWMVCQVLAIPPPAVRPSIKMDGQQRSEDDITHILVDIIKTNDSLAEQLRRSAAVSVAAGETGGSSDPKVVEGWHTLLQYYVATQVNNNIPGVGPVAQRSGRPLKSIQERLNGKAGRVRGNLMGKRVDFSARSVITPDPNISIRELGIPVRIAKNITKPVVVNDMNRDFLMALVKNRSETYPGAKILEKVNGQSISLRYADVSNITLETGDIVHRHMMDGDAILFNRQPSLHRMSMMCHIVRVMHTGDTFRMNVGDTKPYNADFDGDEMNMHMPQDDESELELRHLAAVPYQIISPAKNESIIGIFQDSLLGSYLFTRENVEFTPLKAMGLLVGNNKINGNLFKFNRSGDDSKNRISNFQILSQIMPPLSMRFKNGHFSDEKDKADTSNRVVEIKDGQYLRGQIEKGVLSSGGNGLIQRICNDFGNMASADFIDNLQNIVTEYMKATAYSVGISDLMSNPSTVKNVADTKNAKKQEVKNIIDQVHLGVFENKTGRSNSKEFETKITNILNNATSECEKIVMNTLNKDNRFGTIVKCGSKGTQINISQMISCLGQQSIEGGRIPYGLDGRTLPHFTRFDDTPSARGFIDNSFISGLRPEELFFHAMAGRIGLIDTAVKTSSTGYIQRRLVKGLEDLMVCYDMTVRNSKGRIVQFTYGDDGIDTIKVERATVPFLEMCVEEFYAHYSFPTSAQDAGVEAAGGGSDNAFQTIFTAAAIRRMKMPAQITELNAYSKRMTDDLIRARDEIVENVFRHRNESRVFLPVGIQYVISNIQGMNLFNKNSMVDITPLEAFKMVQDAYDKLETLTYSKPAQLFRVMYFYYLSPRDLLMVKRFNKRALTILLETIIVQYKRALIAPGEMVGMIAAQSIGEPTTQLTLNTFHNAGVASKANVTRGVPRIEEILSLSENPKNTSVTIYAKPDDETDKERVQDLIPYIEHTRLVEVVSSVEIRFDPNPNRTVVDEDDMTLRQYNEFEKMLTECHAESEGGNGDSGQEASMSSISKWVVRLEMDVKSMLDKRITMNDVNYAIKSAYGDMVSCVFSDYNADNLVFRIRLENIIKKTGLASGSSSSSSSGSDGGLQLSGLVGNSKQASLDQSDHIYVLKNFRDQLLNNIILRGVKGIGGIVMRKVPGVLRRVEGNYVKNDIWVMDTMGTNLMQVLALESIDTTRTVSNDIQEIYRVLGIEAARVAIMNELVESFDDTYINYHHLSVLCDRMTANERMISIFRHGINSDNIGPIAKASFEETPEMFLKAARHAEVDNLRGVSSNVMCGQEGYYGTSSFNVLLNLRSIQPVDSTQTPPEAHGDDLGNPSLDIVHEEETIVGSTMLVADEFVASAACSTEKLELAASNGLGVKPKDLGAVSESYELGF